jgi:hypothetical protein
MQIVNPIIYPEWDSLLLRSNNPSFFHTSVWAKVLETSYRFKPIYLTSIEKDQLVFLMPLMEVRSFLTGRRGVSLPFSDQCEPFIMNREYLQCAIDWAIDYGEKSRWKYIEWRDDSYSDERTPPSATFYAHELSLDMTEGELFSSFRDNNRRNINRAVNKGVSVSIEQSLDAVKAFFRLNCITRKRHGLSPQPYSFFKNIFAHAISQGNGIVVCARQDQKTIAASMFFHFGTNALYKYGASDLAYQNLRPNNLIMWEAIKWYKNHAVRTLSLGRTELDNLGLLQYKRTWGAKESIIKYHRFYYCKKSFVQPYMRDSYKKIFSRTPMAILRIAGRLLSRHFG